MSNLPLVSIIIPVYNRSLLIQETLHSLQYQTYPYWEAVVVDDNSIDLTCEYVEKIAYQDSRIQLVRKLPTDQHGANASRNIGIEVSRGKYIIFLDSDDCLSADCLGFRVNIMESAPNLDFSVFQCQLFKRKIGDTDILWNIFFEDKSDLDRFLSLDTPWSIMSPIWKKRVFEKIGYFDCKLLSWQDWEFHIRALSSGLKYKKIDKIDCYYRQHNEISIGKFSATKSHLYSHEYLFQKVCNDLLEKKLLSNRKKILLCGLYFWLSSSWGMIDKKKSIKIWKQSKVINEKKTTYYIIYLYFILCRIKLIRKCMHNYLRLKTPIVSTRMSKTFRKVNRR